LAADLGARDGRVLLEQDADGGRGQQEPDHAVVVGAGNEVVVVVQDGGDDARRTVGGSGDDAATGGVLLVDREGVQVDPIHRPHRVSFVVGFLQVSEQLRSSPGYPQATGENLLGAGAAPVHALLHDGPDVQQLGA
jgi:hypothetical protein